MPSKKHYIITSITLGVIAAASAGLIGLTNFFTRDAIKRNEEIKFNQGIAEIFGDDSKSSVFNADLNLGYLVSSYHIDDSSDKNIGWAVKTSGSNNYGKITMLVGFDYESKVFKGVYLIKNEQTYASTLVDNYVNPVNDDQRDYTDVSCGATYGAKLIRDMINAAQSYVDGIVYD